MIEAICVAVMCIGVTVAIVLMIGHAFGFIELAD